MNYHKFKKAIAQSWCQDTAYHKDAPNWTPNNPALGQCAVTALLFNEFFGGTIYSGISDTGIMHFWNTKYGFKIDLTKQQFSGKIKFTNITQWDRRDLLQTGDVAVRYELLKKKVLATYAEI